MGKESKCLYTLKNGEKKWMTKREYNQYIKRIKSLKPHYDSFVELGILDDTMSINDKVHTLVNCGVNLMYTIGETADKITISGYNSVKNQVNQYISKEDFVAFVKFVATHENSDNIDDTKLTEKLLKEINQVVYNINLKNIMYNQFIEFKDFVVPQNPKNVIFPKIEFEKNKKFKEIVNSCAKARKYLDEILWPEYKSYADVAEYVTQGELTYEQYKKLVDYQYYTDDPDPRFQNQDKRWQKLLENFMKSYKLCEKYGYDYFNDIDNYIINKYNNSNNER